MNVAYEYASLKYSRNGTPCPSSPHPHPSSPSPTPTPEVTKCLYLKHLWFHPQLVIEQTMFMDWWCGHDVTCLQVCPLCDGVTLFWSYFHPILSIVPTDIIELYANCSSALLHWPCPSAPKFTLSCVTTPYRFRVTIRAVSSIVLCHNIHNLLQWQLRAPIL